MLYSRCIKGTVIKGYVLAKCISYRHFVTLTILIRAPYPLSQLNLAYGDVCIRILFQDSLDVKVLSRRILLAIQNLEICTRLEELAMQI